MVRHAGHVVGNSRNGGLRSVRSVTFFKLHARLPEYSKVSLGCWCALSYPAVEAIKTDKQNASKQIGRIISLIFSRPYRNTKSERCNYCVKFLFDKRMSGSAMTTNTRRTVHVQFESSTKSEQRLPPHRTAHKHTHTRLLFPFFFALLVLWWHDNISSCRRCALTFA